MSLDYSFSFETSTPPEFSFEDALFNPDFSPGHSRSCSQSSVYSVESTSPAGSVSTTMTTPARSPIRQHGPLLLPKIRPQDQEIGPPVKISAMKTGHLSAFKPSHHRSHTNPEAVTLTADIFPSHTRAMSTLCSPIGSLNPDDHTRRSSSASLDGQTLGKYGFPTYRQMPTYISSPSKPGMDLYAVQQPYNVNRTPSPLAASVNFDDLPVAYDDGTSTSLMAYLTSPNPAPALVRQLNIHIRDTNTKHFWWDIRQIRPWTSFNTTTISQLPDLHALLSIAAPSFNFPIPDRTSTQPETEIELQNIYNTFYATKLNAALSLSQGKRHIMMRATPSTSTKAGDPSFISNYTDDASQMIYGRGFGRVIGLVKSFDRWNTGMRVEGNHRKVEYLRGLAHLHRHMREHGCRYGFIMTEIELVVVRNGGETTPHFGYLEVQTIRLTAYETQTSTFAEVEGSFACLGEVGDENLALPMPEQKKKQPKMTALLALWYLHLLARDSALPGQVGWKSEIGAPAEGTRRKCMPKDGWIPEPQLAEKREAKRVRGWVWPEEGVGRKELGKRGVRYGNGVGAGGGGH